ncbi:hypothetical protein SETIT_9G278900v2 [Setaria italica]|uniref:Uncharacterized protein n=1 Tax=Setaria italica TaxID=4555 RepID=A0A368SLH1_SETIT|nr:hypothetical protein SETIT_9G278900v2 [Setaria italica]
MKQNSVMRDRGEESQTKKRSNEHGRNFMSVWYSILQHTGLFALAPQPTDSLYDWWVKMKNSVSGDARKGLNSLIILGAWTIWRHRNDCVSNGAAPSIGTARILARHEAQFWSVAEAKGLTLLTARGIWL